MAQLPTAETPAWEKDGAHAADKRFPLTYVGWSALDRRTTLPMLPWLVADIRRRSERGDCGPATQPREVQLVVHGPFLRCVPRSSSGGNCSVFIFEHKAQHISRFLHNSNDLTYFAYLLRAHPDDPKAEMSCHVFKACDPNQVPEVISSIRQVSKSALKEDTKPKQEADEAFYNSQKFEVLYCGKVTLGHKKASSTLVDDCIEKFRQHEVKRKRLLNGQRGSVDRTPVEFTIGVGADPLSHVLNAKKEDGEGLREDGVTERAAAASSGGGSQSNLRGAFPECILEDSGFQEPQEFRTRCSSLAGSPQRKAGDGVGMEAARRRHASAPNHVQPSDSDANRTMLFQVGRFEVNLISPDSKTVVLEKNFKDISSCCQAVKQTDHFGFICRDHSESGPSQYVCFVFQCASESLVDEVMLTLKQAFSTAASLQSSKTLVQLCEACPMHDLHKLCERIEGLYPPRAKLAIQKYVSQLADNEQADVFERVQRLKPASDQEENELVVLQLRQLCESKQKTHRHIGEAPQSANNSAGDGAATGGRFMLDVLKNKARSSLTSSLENILARGASRMRGRLGSMGSMSSFDKQDEDSSGVSPPASPPPFPDDDPEAGQQFRRRAHTFSHPPVKKRISFEGQTGGPARQAGLRRQHSAAPDVPQSSPAAASRARSLSESQSSGPPSSTSSSFSAPTFLKNIYQGSLGSLSSLTDSGSIKSNGDGRKRTLSGCSSDSLSGPSPSPRRVSWRQKIFMRVASPMGKTAMHHAEQSDARELLPLSPGGGGGGADPPRSRGGGRPRRTGADYRALWKTAVRQQILLLRMEKENQRLEASRDELHIRKMKLSYQEVGGDSQDAQALWDKKLTAPGRTTVRQDRDQLYRALCQGVPKSRRGEVWLLLCHQHRLRRRHPPRQPAPDTPYRDLLKQLTAQQHAILVDLGRTFPNVEYFSAQLGAGQLSLYNLLKAYSLLDAEVGYCQGVSFVAGVLLLHMSEEQAFDTLKFLMYDLAVRRQYKPDMVSLQIQMYQLSRLLHDYNRDLYHHLEEYEICPSLYAAPWFLTLFASQFPLGFVSRIFDFLFVQGTEVIFKVALCLLSSHQDAIVECDSFESIVSYLKSTLPSLGQAQMEETIAKVTEMDISKQLHAYEVEYHVLRDEAAEGGGAAPDDSERLDKLEKTNAQLKKQNMELLEKLQAARQKIQTLESNVETFLSRESKMKHVIRTLEQERAAQHKTVERMRACLPPDALADVEMTHIKAAPADAKAKKP
ncbi:TBC1 domain family member 4 isoform X2 [Syngnathoides biaculeatus]|uniref:TBC1 domain family member 4 isoform X2 n=1 Tax=Syngnathoides biaculeatus TaxID=300417 RepID=UPI002ADDFDE1|nr:TBC1 domain family member 4 isoform X2 [Syngnathoides biaculeatus]